MRSNSSFKLPVITDEDISHVSPLLGLPTDAFYGPNGDDPRQDVIKRMDCVDVAACPGSGKTTLLVAKLAILAKKWSSSSRGICVLSHTNAARHEIEKHLGNTSEGQKLLGYPHYIGTIHGFVNEFLALPYLRSSGHASVLFNSEISKQIMLSYSKGGKKLPGYFYIKIKNEELRIDAVCNATYIGSELDISINAGNVGLILNRNLASKSFNTIDQWKKNILTVGYASYGDAFAYGQKMLVEYPEIISIIRGRYPLVFIDEAQDNSNDQTDILNRIFMKGGSSIVRQRYGDANQEIYDFQGAKEPLNDAFPDPNPIELPNSHRFGQRIASLADPLGLNPYGLKGAGPKWPLVSELGDQNTIFLFDENNAGNVLSAYGDLILDVFSEQETNEYWFKAYAVGNIHKSPKKEEASKFPHHVKHYMAAYDHELNKSDPDPSTFLQYLSAGKSISDHHGETYPMVEKIAEAILRLSSFNTEQKVIERRRHKHRYILDLLMQDTDQKYRQKYLGLITKLSVECYFPGKDEWENSWCNPIKTLAKKIAGTEELKLEADEFLSPDVS